MFHIVDYQLYIEHLALITLNVLEQKKLYPVQADIGLTRYCITQFRPSCLYWVENQGNLRSKAGSGVGEKEKKLLSPVLHSTLISDKSLAEDYTLIASDTPELDRLLGNSGRSADVSKQIEAYFKINTGSISNGNERQFGRAAEEMLEFAAALGAAKIRPYRIDFRAQG